MRGDRVDAAMVITLDDNTAINAFFKKFSRVAAEVKANIYHELPQIIRQRPHKIKAAWGLKHHGQIIMEYKIALKPQPFRAAYVRQGQHVKVIFISDVLVKRDFVKALAATQIAE